jgi:hypothetical protein
MNDVSTRRVTPLEGAHEANVRGNGSRSSPKWEGFQRRQDPSRESEEIE